MRPVFSSSRQILGFALLLAAVLALPGLIAGLGVLRRVEVPVSPAWQFGPFGWIDSQIRHRTNEVDMVFLGSSRLFVGINPAMVQERLSAQLGRPAEVFTLGWNGTGYDAVHVVARDLLAHRKVRMLVIYDDFRPNPSSPHTFNNSAFLWLRPGADSVPVASLPGLERVQLYAGAVLRTPRFLASRPRRSPVPGATAGHPDEAVEFPDMAKNLGAQRVRRTVPGQPPFEPFAPVVPARETDVAILSRDAADSLTDQPPLPPYQAYWARELAQLCQAHGTRLVALQVPLPEARLETRLHTLNAWPAFADVPVPLVGLPGAQLFGGLSAEEVQRFYYDPIHLNVNGADHFTKFMIPALLQLHAAATNRF